MIKLGSKVRDAITGLEGIAIGRAEHLHDTPTVGVEPPLDKDGNKRKVEWLSEARLTVIES